MFGERQTRPLFSIAGIPVGISPWHFALLAMLFFQLLKKSLPLGLGVVLIASFSVLAHELGHAMVARYFRLQPRIQLSSFGGLTYHEPTHRPRDHFLITAAGPATNFLLGGLIWMVLPSGDSMLPEILLWGVYVNVVWGVFNLVPIWPLDGGILLLVILRKVVKGGLRADRAVHMLGLGLSVLGALWALSGGGGLLMVFILGMTGMYNWRALQALGRSPVRHETKAHEPVRDMLVQARDAYQSGDFDTAIRLSHQARAEPFLSLEEVRHVWHILALSSARLAQYDDAIRYAERLPESLEMAQVLAVCIVALDDAQRARKFLVSPAARLIDAERQETLRVLARRANGAAG